MNQKEAKKYIKDCKAKEEYERKVKTYKGDWYSINSILGNDWARFFYLLGGREAGKSYSVTDFFCRQLKNKALPFI